MIVGLQMNSGGGSSSRSGDAVSYGVRVVRRAHLEGLGVVAATGNHRTMAGDLFLGFNSVEGPAQLSSAVIPWSYRGGATPRKPSWDQFSLGNLIAVWRQAVRQARVCGGEISKFVARGRLYIGLLLPIHAKTRFVSHAISN
jgi:hypothetical protein